MQQAQKTLTMCGSFARQTLGITIPENGDNLVFQLEYVQNHGTANMIAAQKKIVKQLDGHQQAGCTICNGTNNEIYGKFELTNIVSEDDGNESTSFRLPEEDDPGEGTSSQSTI